MKSLKASFVFMWITVTSHLLLNSTEASSNILGQRSGFCFKQIPRKSIAGRCTTDEYCRDLVNHPVNYALKCGNFGECIVQHPPHEELCKDACENSPCGKFCLHEHETKLAKYCITARDHPNALPPGVLEQNQYHCVCIAPDIFAHKQ